ncbi:hypothetical protein V8E53_004617 [Lactarius tabidus]
MGPWVQSNFARRGMRFSHNDELTRPSYRTQGGSVLAERCDIATQLLRWLSDSLSRSAQRLASALVPVQNNPDRTPAREITRSNAERKDFVIRTNRANGFSWYIAPSNVSFVAFTTSSNGTILGGYAVLPEDIRTVDVHIGIYLGGAKHVARLQRGTLIGFLSPELTLNVFTGRMAPFVEEYCRLVAPAYF